MFGATLTGLIYLGMRLSEGAQCYGHYSQSRVTGLHPSCLSNLLEDAVDVTHAGRVLPQSRGCQCLLCTIHGGEVALRASLSHGQCEACSSLVEAAAHCLACQDLPAVAAGQLGDEAEQFVHLEAVVGCEVDRCQRGCPSKS